MADITREIAKKDAKILLDTIGMVQTFTGKQTVGGTQQEWSTYLEKGNTVVELKKIIEKYNSSEALKLLESEYEKLYFKKGGLDDLKGSLLNKNVFSEDQMSRIVKLKKENPNKSLLELDLIDEGREYSKIKRDEKGKVETSMFTNVGDLYSKHKETIAKQIPVNEKHPNADITLEEITKRFQGGDPTIPLDVDDINALDVRSAIDLIINNKLPLTNEARSTLFNWLKYADEDYRNNFISTYFSQEEIDHMEGTEYKDEIDETIPVIEEGQDVPLHQPLETPDDITAPEILDKDKDGIPDSIDIAGGTGTDKSLVEQTSEDTEEPPLTNLEKAGKVGESLLKGAGAALDAIGGPGAIISYIMGKKGLKAAMKEIDPQASPELSPMFMQHLRQTRELAKKGFHPDQARKFRKELDKSYQIGLENAVRGSGGQRARFLAQSGVLDAQRSSALLDYAVADEELQAKNQEKYEKMMLFKENFDIQRTEKERAEDMERQIADKKAAAGFTAAAFTNLLSGFGSSSLVPNPAPGTTNLYDTIANWGTTEQTTEE